MIPYEILLVTFFQTLSIFAMNEYGLYRNTKVNFNTGKFKRDYFHYLWTEILASFMVKDHLDCALLCVDEPKCYSFNMAAYPSSRGNSLVLLNSNDLHLCELLATDKYRATEKLLRNDTFHHLSPESPCDSAPCKNGTVCVPEYQCNSYRCECNPGFHRTNCDRKDCKFDFEDGIRRWIRTGTAFNNQPTYGDNPAFRGRESANQQGNWWIGGYENRPSPGATAGTVQGDGPLGTLTTPPFHIEGKNISYLIGGGCNPKDLRAELIINNQVVRQATGKCSETMVRQTWSVQEFIGQRARVKLVDNSSVSWGHINFDDLTGDISCERDL